MSNDFGFVGKSGGAPKPGSRGSARPGDLNGGPGPQGRMGGGQQAQYQQQQQPYSSSTPRFAQGRGDGGSYQQQGQRGRGGFRGQGQGGFGAPNGGAGGPSFGRGGGGQGQGGQAFGFPGGSQDQGGGQNYAFPGSGQPAGRGRNPGQQARFSGRPPAAYEEEDLGQGGEVLDYQQPYHTMVGPPSTDLPPSMVTLRQGVPQQVAAPVAVAPAEDPANAPKVAALTQQVRMLETAIKNMAARMDPDATAKVAVLATAVTQCQDATKVFYGLVEGGADGDIKLYRSLPTDAQPDPVPAAKAVRGRWLRMSYPKIVMDSSNEHGGTTAHTWYSVQVINPKNADVEQFWARERTADGAPSFTRFDMYPRDLS